MYIPKETLAGLSLTDFCLTLEISLWQLRGWRWHWSWQLDLAWKEEKVKLNRTWWVIDDGQLSSRLSLKIQINSDIGQWKWVREERLVIHWSQTKNKSIHTHNVPHSTIELYISNKCPNGYHGQGKDFRCIWICTQLGSKASCRVESAFYWAAWILWPLATQSITTFTSLRWKNYLKCCTMLIVFTMVYKFI